MNDTLRLGRILGVLALLTGSSAMTQVVEASVRVVEYAGGESALVLTNGEVFRMTPDQIQDLRTIVIPGSSKQIYRWQEQGSAGTLRSFYAIGARGRGLLGRVRQTTFSVHLRDFSFDPVADGEPEISAELSARAENALYLVQFECVPLPEFRQTISDLGGKVLRFLTDHTFIVEMTARVRSQVAALSYVRWVGSYHPGFRLEKPLRDAIKGQAPTLAPQRYSIMLGERSTDRQRELAAVINGLGAPLDLVAPGGLRVEATLTQDQLLDVANANEVQFIDRWGGPGEIDMDVVRVVGGGDYIEGLRGWTGQGVRGEVFDTELRTTHQEWPTAPIIHSSSSSGNTYHGTSCYSNNFAEGIEPSARGMLPSAQGIFFRYTESTQFGGSTSRYDINQELIDPAGQYRAVFQTASVGSARGTAYTTISAEVDDYLFLYPILSTQSMGDSGNQDSRPQAWAKNIVSVGGIYHRSTADRCDDEWGSGASIGPAADGRIKPDFVYFYDNIYSARGAGDSSYTQFGGASSAPPQTSGHFGILFQMWHQGVWFGHGGGVDVFGSRPQMVTAKALMVNSAYRYDWTNPGGCTYSDVDRNVQGWGTPDLQRLYDRAPVTMIIDESDLIEPLETIPYQVEVAAGEPELNVTLAYTDPMGTVGAVSARINDLSLRLRSPSGVSYWGNHGLDSGNFSASGGVSNTVDTVECIFIENPEAGTWLVEVIGDEIVQDAHAETPELDADFALVIGGVVLEHVFADGFETGDLLAWSNHVP